MTQGRLFKPRSRGWYHLTGLIPKSLAPSIIGYLEGLGEEVIVKRRSGGLEIKHRKRVKING